MSYLVLARKYRPRRFEELVGQEHVVQALGNALTQQRLHHAYLFTGTRGVGKTTVSRILAKSLNCTGPDGQGGITATPCEVCPSCRDIQAGRFVDYVELDAASNRGVDEISQLLDQAVYKPVVGRFKVYMIDEVHMLSNTAFNAMLKTLEEPPDYLKFVLATTDPQKVPVTVLSRCLQFNLRPMAPATVQAHLATVLAAESIDAEAGALRVLARAAQGSMRDALSLADQAIAYGGGRLQEAAVLQMLGAVDDRVAVQLCKSLAAGDGPGLVAACEALRVQGLSPGGALDAFVRLLQAVALAQVAPLALDPDDPLSLQAGELTQDLAPDELQLYYSMALHGRQELALAPDEHSGLVMLLLRMLSFRPTERAPGLRMPAKAEGDAPGAHAPSPAAAPVATPAPTPVAAAAAAPPAGSGPSSRPLVRPVQAPSARVAVARASVPPARDAAAERSATSEARPDEQPPAPRRDEDLPPWLDLPPEDEHGATASIAAPPACGPDPIEVTGEAGPSSVRPQELPAPSLSDEDRRLGDRWYEVVRLLQERQLVAALTRELAMQAQCVGVDADGQSWQLRVERDTLRAAAQVERLQQALRQALGPQASVSVEGGAVQDSPALREAQARRERQRAAEEALDADADFQWLRAHFKTARVVPGSIKPIGP